MFDSNNRIEVNKCINFRGWKKRREQSKKPHIFLRFVEEGGFAVTVIFILCTEMLKCEIFDRRHLFRVRIGYSFRACIPNISKWDCCDETKLKTDTANQRYVCIIESDWQSPAFSLVSLFKFAGFEQYMCTVQRMIENKKNYLDLLWEW